MPPKKDRNVVFQEAPETDVDIITNGAPYVPKYPKGIVPMTSRDDNPVVYLEISASGGHRQLDGLCSIPRIIGRLYFELRKDLVPVASANFLSLVKGSYGINHKDSIRYHYLGTKIHRVVKNKLFQAGDLLGESGHCSRSVYQNGGLFADENFILRHTGPGCLSMCNRGPDTNGSLFQVTFTAQELLDERCVVFGCLCTAESYRCLEALNDFGTKWGDPLEGLVITACEAVFPPENVDQK